MVENHVEGPHDLEPSKNPFELVALYVRSLILGALISRAAWMLVTFIYETFARRR